MSRLFPRLMLVVGIGMTGAACQDGGYGAPRDYNLAQTGYGNPNYNSGYYGPRPGQSQNGYSQQPGYTTVIVTNRGQNGKIATMSFSSKSPAVASITTATVNASHLGADRVCAFIQL